MVEKQSEWIPPANSRNQEDRKVEEGIPTQLGPAFETVVYNDFNELASAKYRFQQLLDSSNCRQPFSMFEWFESWCRVRDGRSRRVIIVVARQNTGKWVGLLPLTVSRYGPADLWAPVAEIIGSAHADYSAPIIQKDCGGDVLHLLLDSTLSLLPRGGILALRHWPLHDENFRVALQYLAHSRFNHIVVEHVCPVLYLSGRYEDIERGWKTKHRNDTRRQVKRLEQRGTCTLKLLTPEDDFDAHLHCFFRMHTRTWKERGYRSVFESPTIRGQYMVLSKEMPRNVLHFSALLLNGRPISYHFGFLFDRWFYYYKPAYDSRYKEYSPGKVHVAYLIRMGCDENWVAFDFMRGAEPYKFLWTKDTRQTASLFITRGARDFRLRWMLNGKRRVYGRVGRYYRRAQLFLGT